MRKLIITVLFLFMPLLGMASTGDVHLDHIELDLQNKASLQSGLKTFVNYCMGCHSARFSRYERVADDLGIPHDAMLENLTFGGEKIGSLMDKSMTSSSAKIWFGAPPPDLTLVARVRSPDWLYTYMRSFYRDEDRVWGVNNLTFPNVGMPHVLEGLQGVQQCVADAEGHCEQLEITRPGSMSTQEYDKTIYDLVNFLEYLGEPMVLKRQSLGVNVLIFILFLSIFVYLLNREYWKDIH